MDLRQLEVFRAVCEERSFSRAAERLGLTQPTVSGHIKALERFFGAPLLDRLGRRTAPTRVGEFLYRQSQQLLELKRLALEGMSRLLGGLEGDLRLGASTIPGEFLLPELIGRFHASHPKIRIAVEISDSRGVIEAVGAGRVDLGFAGARLEDGGLEFTPFAFDHLVLAVPGAGRWAKARSAALEELRTAPLVIRERGSGTRSVIEERLGELGYALKDFNVVAELGSAAAVKEAIKAGVGWSIVSDISLRTETAAGVIRTLPIAGVEPWRRDFYVVLDPRRTTSPTAETFLGVVSPGAAGAG
jgi:DNA-binding transcriptional LysR family regulator